MNTQPSLSEDSMTSAPSYLVISLALMQREHQRLDASAKQLRLGTIPVEQLYSLRQQWQTSLGFLAFLPPLLASLDRLIEQHEHGNVAEAAYGDVLYQIVVYRGASWRSLEPALFTRALIERSEGTGCWHCLSGFASSARVA
ncbi:hypothetical protein ACPA0G_15425, partial [Vreelandella venusta]